jgi:hypothetical protein
VALPLGWPQLRIRLGGALRARGATLAGVSSTLRIRLPALVALALALALAATGAYLWLRPSRGAAATCPAGHVIDPARSKALWARLAQVPEGAALIERSEREPAMCFGPAQPSVVSGGGLLLLDARLADDEAAARVGHLVSHVLQGDQLDPEAPAAVADCEAFGASALAAEKRAHALELRLLRALRALSGSTADAEPDARAMASAVAAAYLDRCRRVRDAAGRR